MSRKVCLLSFGVERGPRRGRPLLSLMGSRPRPAPLRGRVVTIFGHHASHIDHVTCAHGPASGWLGGALRPPDHREDDSRLCSNCPPYTKLCLCGHSLGGGLAALMAVLIGPMLRKRYGWRLAGWRGPAPCLGGRGLMAHGRSRAGTRVAGSRYRSKKPTR